MARKRGFDEEHVLQQVMNLFWHKGYEATSMSDLTAATGLQKPSLYAAFGDKQALFEAALRRYNHQHAQRIDRLLQQDKTARQSFERLFQYVTQSDDQHQTEYGCFCINTMVELAPHDERFAVLTREHQMYLSALFTRRLERAIVEKELSPDYDAQAHAQTLVTGMLGLTVMLKTNPDPAFIHATTTVLLSSLIP
ncbi:TetR/AcrR family transcriptional regulator [Paenibacillus hunanensis]|uniref:TetR/AcrR family transcriptional regulator n=1 Tax=Paenibacillus hunanensis TaxID=539262 RepID=UPI002A69E0BC|nr:TetR/AcrR family transcriptional regulator [Paenibacillus hunanensis]WPP39941.1 TetR/AcrR family transcriptional regulator [Paenibacillus hunanensis]